MVMIAKMMWLYKAPPEAPEVTAMRTKINKGKHYHEYLKSWLGKMRPVRQKLMEDAAWEKRLRDIRIEAEKKYRPDVKVIKTKPDVPDVPIWR